MAKDTNVLHRRLSDGTLPLEQPLGLDEIPKEQLYEEIKKGCEDCAAGRTLSAKEVFRSVETEFGL